jgi:hypothetical protein
MPNQIVLAWTVDAVNTVLGPAGAATALGAVDLYTNPTTDPVLGQLFGLTVASDVTAPVGPTTATRTLTLNMANGVGALFPCHPRTSTPPVLPYPLREAVSLPGSFFVSNGSSSVAVSATQKPSLVIGDTVQFMAQQGVFYTVASVGATSVGLTAPYTGTSGNSEAFKEVSKPATRVAVFSTSPLDTNGVATTPAITAGPGARTILLTYKDSTGAGPFSTTALLTGKRPVAFTLAGGSIDVAEIEEMSILAAGSFGSSVGQITLVELSSDLPPIPSDATPGTGIGAGQGDRTFVALTDQAQLLIARHLAYLPPSYSALAQQGAATPRLDVDFIVTTGSKDVPTTEDTTLALASGNMLQFASQPGTFYEIATVTPKMVTLTTPYSGTDNNFTGSNNPNSNIGTKGNLGPSVIAKRTGGGSPSTVLSPSNDQLSTPVGQFVALETASPPPNPPLSPATVTAPTFLSGLLTQTIRLKCSAPITSQTIAFA